MLLPKEVKSKVRLETYIIFAKTRQLTIQCFRFKVWMVNNQYLNFFKLSSYKTKLERKY